MNVRLLSSEFGAKRRLPRVLMCAFLACGLASACSGETDDPDGDDRRGRAIDLPIGQVVTDTIDPPEDSIDWKIIEVPGTGFLTVSVFWDDPEVMSTVRLVDKYGIPVQEVIRDPRQPKDQIILKAPEPSFYFVSVECSEGKSVYSIQTSFEGGVEQEVEVPIPEFVTPIEPGTEGDEVKPPAGGGGDGGGGGGGPALPPMGGAPMGGGGPAPVAALPPMGGGGGGGGGMMGGAPSLPPSGGGGGRTAAPTSQLTDLVPDYLGAANVVEAQVLRVIPKGRGGSELTIGVGSRQGVATNNVGEVMMTDGSRLEGGRFVVTQVFKNSALCETNAPANMVSAAEKVIVKIPKGP